MISKRERWKLGEEYLVGGAVLVSPRATGFYSFSGGRLEHPRSSRVRSPAGMFVRLFAAEPVMTRSNHPTLSIVAKQRAECVVDGWVISEFGRSARSFKISERDEVDRG
jgi:hypothetical protein